MLESSTIEGTNIVTATYEGSLSADDMDALRDRLSTVIATHGKARLLVQYNDIDVGRIEPEALWKDLKSIGMVDDIERYAVVTDEGLIEKVAAIGERVAPVDLKVFNTADRDDAIAWLSGTAPA